MFVEGLQELSRGATHEAYGVGLRLFYRFSNSLREGAVSQMVQRVGEKGYIDSLTQDELDLFPKQARREAFSKINMRLIHDKYTYAIEYRNREVQ